MRDASRFLQRTESVLLPSLCSARSCSERLKDVQQALLTLDKEFASHLTEIQTLGPVSPLFSAQKAEQLQVEILGCLVVRMSALKAQAQLRLEALERYMINKRIRIFLYYGSECCTVIVLCSVRCVNSQRSTRVCYEELCRCVRDSETTLAECATKKITSPSDCQDQQEKLKVGSVHSSKLCGRFDSGVKKI